MEKIFFSLSFTIFVLYPVFVTSKARAEEYVFDSTMLRGNSIKGISARYFDVANYFEPGEYSVDIYLNDKFQTQANIKLENENGKALVCLPGNFFSVFGVKPEFLKKIEEKECYDPESIIPGSHVNADISKLRIDISAPQATLVTFPKGYIPVTNLTAGQSIGFINYNINEFHTTDKFSGQFESTYMGLNTGINVGMWRLRQQGNINHDREGWKWQNSRAYVQRAFPSLNSELAAGEVYTPGNLFSSLSFKGVSVYSDDRMLPDSLQGYAPEIRGIAKNNAKVSVYQGNQQIYQTTVSPGQFTIRDISPVTYGGDLTVKVEEANGSISSFRVPYATLPQLLRPGHIRYAFSSGMVRGYSRANKFGELTVQYGTTNNITTNAGLRIGSGYQSLLLGSVYSSELGAFGVNVAYSMAQFNREKDEQGWRFDANYSRTFLPMNTTISFAGYRYSTRGYRDLIDVISLNNSVSPTDLDPIGSYMQRTRFQATINQQLGKYGNVYVSGFTQDYYDGRSRDNQFQVGYSTMILRNIALGFSASRQYSLRSSDRNFDRNRKYHYKDYYKDTLFQVNLSFPLGGRTTAPYVSTGVMNDEINGANYTTSLSGVLGRNQDVTYSVSYNRASQAPKNTLGGSLQKNFSVINLSGTASKGDNHWQASLNAMGSIAVHSGGVTLGNYLSDTFALVEAKGARNTRVLNSPGVSIDRFGYALVPSLMPYRYNTVTLDSTGSNNKVEVQDSQRTFAPYAGAAVKVRFRTLAGYPVMMKITFKEDAEGIPAGAEIFAPNGQNIGTVGQAGNAYVRVSKLSGTLKVKWGNHKNDSCQLTYRIPEPGHNQSVTYFTGECKK